MNCNEIEKLVLLRDSGELPLPRQQELESHLRDCPACRRLQDTLLTVRQEIRTSPVFRSEPAQAVLASIRIAAQAHSRRQPMAMPIPWRGLLAAAASLMLCLAGMAIFTRGPAGVPVAKGRTATEILPLAALVMGNETTTETYTGKSENDAVAEQLLRLQGMTVYTLEDLINDFSSPEDSRPTTLLWNSSCEPRPGRYG